MKIRVVVARPNEWAEIIEIEDELETYQALVGGYIECVKLWNLPESKYALICNEEGKMMGLPVNFINNNDIIVGPVVITALKNDEFAPLDEHEASGIKTRLDLMRSNEIKKRILQQQDPNRLKDN